MPRNNGDKAVKRQRNVQQHVDRADATKGKSDKREDAMQAGARPYPVPPFPAQHQSPASSSRRGAIQSLRHSSRAPARTFNSN